LGPRCGKECPEEQGEYLDPVAQTFRTGPSILKYVWSWFHHGTWRQSSPCLRQVLHLFDTSTRRGVLMWRSQTANHWLLGHIISGRPGVLPASCRDSFCQSVAKQEYPRYCQREGKGRPSVSAAPAMTQYVRDRSEAGSGTSTWCSEDRRCCAAVLQTRCMTAGVRAAGSPPRAKSRPTCSAHGYR
jgi:hypothetical protein